MKKPHNLLLILLGFAALVPRLVFSQHVETPSDSIRQTINSTTTRIQNQLSNSTSRIDSITFKLNYKLNAATLKLNSRIDSLNGLKLAPGTYARQLDGLYKDFQVKTIEPLKQQYDSLGTLATSKIVDVDKLISSKTHFIDSLLVNNGFKSISGKLSLEKFDASLPQVNAPADLNLPTGGIDSKLGLDRIQDINPVNTNVNFPKTDIKMPGLDVPNLDNALDKGKGVQETMEKVNQVQETVGKVGEYAEKISNASEEVEKVKNGEYNKEIDKLAEKQLMKIDEIKQFSAQTKAVDKMKAEVESVKALANQDAMKKRAKKEMVDHFAGKEELIKKDLEDIGKLQMKYRKIDDSRNLPKRIPNEMKGKPFVERLIPAVTFQVYTGRHVGIDFAPSLGYRFSGRVRAGAGAYHRLLFVDKSLNVKKEDLYGARVYNNIRLIKSFYSHLELEHYYNGISAIQTVKINEGLNKWKTELNFGLYRTYSIGKRFNGHVVLLYDLLSIKEFPASRNSAMRFGFDYQVRKKKKKK